MSYRVMRAALLVCLLAFSTGIALMQDAANLTDGCIEQFDPQQDYFPDKVTPEYTTGFTVEYFGSYKLITVEVPWVGADAEDAVQYLLVQCGAPVPEGFEDAFMFEVPVQSFVTMSTTYLPYVEQYGLIDRLVGVDMLSTVTSEAILAEGERLVEIAPNFELNLETALELSPQMIMSYGFGFDTDSYLQLQQNGLPVVLNGEFAETSALARAEWGKFLALFFNQEALAEALFAGVASDYEALAAMAAEVETRPTVFANSPFEGTWYMPGGGSYFALMLADAGADYLWADDPSTGTLFLDFEAVLDRAADADYWINPSQFWFSLDDALAEDPRFEDFAALRTGGVWVNNLRLTETFGNDFYESGVAYPNWILADLIAIFHPELLPEHEFVYYRQLAD